MRVMVIAIGRARADPAAALVAEYRRRLPTPFDLVELELRSPSSPAEQPEREAALLLDALPRHDRRVVVLDQGGVQMSSEAFAKRLAAYADEAVGNLAFLIGGAYGHGTAVKAAADLTLSLGPMTLPHLLARAVLAEQIYRAHTITVRHPYHHG